MKLRLSRQQLRDENVPVGRLTRARMLFMGSEFSIREKISAATLGSRRKVRTGTMICLKRLRGWLPRISLKGALNMNSKLQEWLHDVGVALGLIEPPKLQPIPVRTNDDKRRQPRR